METAIKQDPRYLERRHREYRQDMEMFGKMLFDIYTIMPAGLRIFKNGKIEQHIPPEYQKKIDSVMQQRNEFVKSNYPEFYEQQ